MFARAAAAAVARCLGDAERATLADACMERAENRGTASFEWMAWKGLGYAANIRESAPRTADVIWTEGNTERANAIERRPIFPD